MYLKRHENHQRLYNNSMPNKHATKLHASTRRPLPSPVAAVGDVVDGPLVLD